MESQNHDNLEKHCKVLKKKTVINREQNKSDVLLYDWLELRP